MVRETMPLVQGDERITVTTGKTHQQNGYQHDSRHTSSFPVCKARMRGVRQPVDPLLYNSETTGGGGVDELRTIAFFRRKSPAGSTGGKDDSTAEESTLKKSKKSKTSKTR